MHVATSPDLPAHAVTRAADFGRGRRFMLGRFQPSAPCVSSERVLRIQGYSDLTRVRPAIRRAAEEVAMLAMKLSEPSVAYRHVRIRAMFGETVVLDGGQRLNCAVFPRALRDCEEVVPFVLTVGGPISQRVIDFANAGDLLEAVLLETAGWLCIEDATRQFKGRLREACLEFGSRITSRLGPGYSYKVNGEICMWRLEDQVRIFRLLGEPDELPVSLLSSCAMLPKLSRSGMYGVGPADVTSSASTDDRIPSKEQCE